MVGMCSLTIKKLEIVTNLFKTRQTEKDKKKRVKLKTFIKN